MGFRLPAQFLHLAHQLPVHVAPFPHPVGGKEIRLQGLAELALGFAVDVELIDVAPEIEQGDEVGVLVDEALVFLVGGLLALQGAVAGVLHRQVGGDHQHLGQAGLVPGGDEHAADARVHRQVGELPADGGEVALFVQGAQFGE
jgi:hypothetical protein